MGCLHTCLPGDVLIGGGVGISLFWCLWALHPFLVVLRYICLWYGLLMLKGSINKHRCQSHASMSFSWPSISLGVAQSLQAIPLDS